LSAAAVGFSEIEIPNQVVRQVLQMPSDLLTALGSASTANRLTVVMNRQRTSPYPPRSDPESTISRQFTLPAARTFTLSGNASISALLPDDEIDRLVGRTAAAGGSSTVTAYSSGRLPGDLRATASATLDGNATTAWQPGLGTNALIGAKLTYNLPAPVTLSTLNLQVIADGRHSVPTSISVSAGGVTRQVPLPQLADAKVPDAVTNVPVSFPAVSGRQVVVTFTGVRVEKAANYYSAGPLALPLGIAEIGLASAQTPATPATLPGTCTAGLLTIDGKPISVAVVGSTTSALDNGEVQVVPCGPDAAGLTLSAGTHVVQTALAHVPSCAATPLNCTGWNIDQLVLDSAAGGGAGPAASATAQGVPSLPATQPGAAPKVTVTSAQTDRESATVRGATSPFELVLGQSVNTGWQAVASPGPGAPAAAHAVTLGGSQLVDGFANGWAVTADDLKALGGEDFTVTLTWTPQSEVWAALFVSALTLLGCVFLVVLPVRLRRRLRDVLRRRVPARWRPADEATKTSGLPVSIASDAPELVLPGLLEPDGARRAGVGRAVVVGLLTGAVAAGVTSLGLGLVVAAVVALGLQFPRIRGAATVGGVVVLAYGCLSVVTGQAAHHFLPGSNWAGSFVHAGNVIWVGLSLLLADAVIACVSAGAPPPRPAPPAPGGPSPAT
jgi:hypothetical protein